MGRGLTFVACLAFMTSLPSEARAGSISADVSMTVVGELGNPYPYITSIPDVSSPPSIVYSGPTPLNLSTIDYLVDDNIRTTFNMTITFESPSGSHPSIDVTGNVIGNFDVAIIPSSSPFFAPGGFNLSSSLYAVGTGTSATLQGWTPASGIPISLIEPYLNPSIYGFSAWGRGMGIVYSELYGEESYFINMPGVASVPEPTTALMYLAAIAGLGVWRGARLRRSRTPLGRIDGDN